MGIKKKIYKEKTTYKIFDRIRYDILQKVSFIMITLFMINPALKVLIELISGASIYRYMHEYNKIVLLCGTCTIGIYIKKLSDDRKLSDIKLLFERHRPMILFLIFAILMVITTILNGFPMLAVYGSYYRGEGVVGYLSYLVYFLLSALLVTSKQKDKFLDLYAISSTFVGVVIFIDYIFLNDKYGYAMNDHMVFSQYNHLGYYLLMSIMVFGMLFITRKKIIHKIIYLSGFSFMTVVLIMNDTWGCQIALLVGIIFTIIVYSVGKDKFQPIAIVLLLAMIVTYLVSYISVDRLRDNIEKNIIQQLYDTKALMDKDGIEDITTGVSRIFLWENACDKLIERPVIGHGADMTGKWLIEKAGNDRCHCEFLNYAVSFGIPTAIVYVVAVFMVFLRGLFKKKQLTDMHLSGLCVAFAYLTSSLVGNSMFYTAPFLFITLGFGYVRGNDVE